MHYFKSALKACAIFYCMAAELNSIQAQAPWPSESWTAAVNLTPVMDPAGLTELSGLYWNDQTRRLYVSHGDGRLRVLQLNGSGNFSQIANIGYSGGPEGITQVNLSANEFYTIDENNYQVRKYTHPSDFSSLTLSKSWNITAAPSTMTNTGNTGPEGIAFIPDSFLAAAGFISQNTGSLYLSTKGMGGLIFIAHQNQGYVWVLDINPNVSNDFTFVGKYKTNRSESCELAFDKSTGLLYILHNINGNILEVTDLATTAMSGGERKFVTRMEYYVPNPSGNLNVEGMAITPKCSDSINAGIWFCRDVESVESSTYKKDCLRWFQPFQAPGNCPVSEPVTLNLHILIEGFYNGNGLMHAVANRQQHPLICDTLIVELHAISGNHTMVAASKIPCDIFGDASIDFPESFFGGSYYISVKHRNSLEIWTAQPVALNAPVVEYDFTDAQEKAYGSRLVNIGNGFFAMRSGDVDQNGIIDDIDLQLITNSMNQFQTGYIPEDVNGDFMSESSDYSLVENNSILIVTRARP